jgi:oxygen tolerance protein BatD
VKPLVRAACLVVALVTARAAQAQASQPQVQVQLEADTVGVGDVVHLQVSVTSADDMPSDVQIGATPGFVVRGQNESPSQTHIIANGSRMDRYTLTVDWALQAQRTGTFSVGPLTALVGGSRYSAQRVTIHVVSAGQAPHRARQQRPDPFGSSPFDPFRGFFPGFDDGSQQQQPSAPTVNVDPRLSLEAPGGSYFFLHATVDKTGAAVGEQVTYTVYEYADTSAGDIEVDADAVHDPQAADFVKHPLVPEDQEAPVAGYASIGGRIWLVKIVRRWALFPLHSGDLTIGPMSVILTRPRGVAGQPRATEGLLVHVAEPPLAGRPPGYSSGDVGRFAMAAQVQPREIEQGGAVGVHVDLSGTGNVPEAITPPARDGVEWLTPEVHTELGPTGQGAYGGKRSFDFVVRVDRAGAVDLGDLTLPYWDPDARKYGVARASLGSLRVKPNAAATREGNADAPADRLAGLPPARDALEGAAAARRHSDDSPLFWLVGVCGGPLAFGVAVAGRAGANRIRSVWHGRRVSPLTELRQRKAAVRAACDRSDARAIDATITRALEAATVAHAKVGIRGALGTEVVGRLERAGVEPRVAVDISDLLGECEKGRFDPEASDAAASRARATRALEVIDHLEKRA